MLIPVKWLKDYVNIDIDVKELADKLTMSGSKVEAVSILGQEITNVCVGKIIKIDRHPNADKLQICQVDIGNESIQIVTGATNIKEGHYIPVAKSGATLPGGVTIKKGKLRGEESNGMLCSAKELEISDDLVSEESKDGILILDGQPQLGRDIKEVLGLDDAIIEFEITSNRPDCLSVIGMARETAATLNTNLSFPEIKVVKQIEDIKDYASIIVEDAGLCPRYGAKVVKDVVIKQSPNFIKQRLIQCGVRPINNIVDITNYVMLELGQPLHGFDLDKIQDNKIIVRRAKEGEKIITLDGNERNTTTDDIVITDANGPIALAGVMGGENSEITDQTTTILIESANFNGDCVRKTSKRLGLRSEASSRFEKGVDINLVEKALDRVCQLIEMTESGVVIGGTIDVVNADTNSKVLDLDHRWINKFLGTSISLEDMISILKSLSFDVAVGDKVEVIVPTFRTDIEVKEDLAEEIARIYGYNNIESSPLRGLATEGGKTREQKLEDKVKNIMISNGSMEVVTYSFVSPKVYKTINMEIPATVKIINPLGEDFSIMRTTIVPNILEVALRNYNRGIGAARFFELGNVYIPNPGAELPIENQRLCILTYGNEDFYTLKGVVESLLTGFKVEDVKYHSSKVKPYFHPGRSAEILVGEQSIGNIGEVHPDVMDTYGFDDRLYIADLDMDLIFNIHNDRVEYRPLPKYPSMSRDIALLVKDDIEVAQIEEVIRQFGSKLLEEVRLFDVYKGKQIEEGFKSVAYNLVYRAKDRTLTDIEIAKIQDNILRELDSKLNIKLR